MSISKPDPKSPGDDQVVVQQLTRLEHQFATAALTGDHRTVEGLLDPEFIGVDPHGRVLSRTEVLSELKNKDRTIETLRHENIRVRVFGDSAVVFGVTAMEGRYQGEAFGGKFPYMRVWIRREGHWLAVATQSSR